MNRNYWIAAISIAAAAFALPASAQMRAPSLSSAYIGGSFGQADLDIDCEGSQCDTKDTSWRIFGGYQFSRHFSAELGYANLGEASFDFGPGDRVTVEGTAWDISVVGAIPVGPVSLFGRLGFYRAEVEAADSLTGERVDDSDTGLTWGIGVQYDINRNLAVRAEWQNYNGVKIEDGDDFDVKVLNIGLLYRFQ